MKKIDFKKIIRYFRYKSEGGTSINVLRDWKVAVFCFIALALALAAIDIYVFWRCQKEGGLGVAIGMARDEKPIMIRQEKLRVVLREINKREARFKETLPTSGVSDPSL